MSGLDEHIFIWLRDTLLQCGPLDDYYELMALFSDNRLAPWKRTIPRERTPLAQAETTIEKLLFAEHPSERFNGLVALLQVLRDRVDPGDSCHHELQALTDLLQPMLPPISYRLWASDPQSLEEWRTTRRLTTLLGRKGEQQALLAAYHQMVKTNQGHTLLVLGKMGAGRRALCQWLIGNVKKSGGFTFEVNRAEPNNLKTLSHQLRATARNQGPTLCFIDRLQPADIALFNLQAMADEITALRNRLPILLLISLDCPAPLSNLTAETHTPLTLLAQHLTESNLADQYFLGDDISPADILESIAPANPQLADRLHELVGGSDWSMVSVIWEEWQARKTVGKDGRGIWQAIELLPNQPTVAGVWQPVQLLPNQLSVYGDVAEQVDRQLSALLDKISKAKEVIFPFSIEQIREILNCAATEGELFTVNALAMVLKLDVKQLIDFLDDFLGGEDGLVSKVAGVSPGNGLPTIWQYRFSKPYFYFAYAHYPPLRQQRQQWQLQLGQALEQLYPLNPDPVADKLIALFTRAGHPKLAERYYWRTEHKIPLATLRQRVKELQNSRFTQPVELAYLFILGFELLRRLATEEPGAWSEGVELAQQLQRLAIVHQYPEHQVAATHYLAGHWRNGGHLNEAWPPAKQALELAQRYQVNEDLLATILNLLGLLLEDMGDPAGGRPYLEKALAIKERVLGPDHPDTAASLNNLGTLLADMGDPAGARPYLERALAIRERVRGPDHPDTAASLNSLGLLRLAMGDPAGARPYLERALAILVSKLGPNHPHTQIVRNWLSFLSDKPATSRPKSVQNSRMIRAFIAIEFPAGTRTFLANTGRDLAALLPPNRVKWLRPEQMHLTLFFLGDTPTEKLPTIAAGLDGVTARFAPFSLQLDKLGCFPNPGRPRVIWVGLQGEIEKVKALQKQVEAMLQPLGWPAESKPFTPHLTLGRVRAGQPKLELPWGQEIVARPVTVAAIQLIQSELLPAGPIYTVRHTSHLSLQG